MGSLFTDVQLESTNISAVEIKRTKTIMSFWGTFVVCWTNVSNANHSSVLKLLASVCEYTFEMT